MDRVKLLGSYLKKSPLIVTSAEPGVRISPNQFTLSVRVRDDRRPIKQNTTKNQVLGLESEKQATAVHNEYLNALQLPYLARTFPRSDQFDYKKAAQFSNSLNRALKTRNAHETVFALSSQDVAKLISCLLQVSGETVSLVPKVHSYERECFTDIPKITEEVIGDIRVFENYIGLLTHTKFYHSGSSSQNGIIPKLLKSLLHPSNLRTASLKTATVFNDIIYYYGNKNNFATCRELYAQMKSEGVAPNTHTYNLLLRNLLKNSKLIKQKLPYGEAIFYLEKMQKENVPADVITWNTCYFLLKDDISRAIFLEKMVEKNVPLTHHLLYRILEEEDIPFNSIIDFLQENNIPVDTKIIMICHRSLVKRDNFQAAWKLMEYASGLKFNISDPLFLEQFLRQFAEKGRMDMSVLTINSFKSWYGIKPTIHCYELLFKCLVRQGYSPQFSAIYQMLISNLREYTNGKIIMNYWIAKCRAILTNNIKTHATIESVKKLDKLAKTCTWDKKRGIRWTCWSQYPEYRKIFRKLGSIPYQTKTEGQFDKAIAATAAKKKLKYLKKLKETAVNNKNIGTDAYKKDYYSALKNDLVKRGIIEEHVK